MADNQTTPRPKTLVAEQSNGEKASNQRNKPNFHHLDIALGKHRNEKNWRNRSVSWTDYMVVKCANTHRTAESFAEFMAATKARQDEIKDVGAFVGGYLANGRRKKDSITHRQLVTLDADFASVGIWVLFTLNFDCASLLYSTHKHTPEKPRVRILIPLDRPVSVDEYEAISRKIAGKIGIEQFDHTTFQANRLMYWPSTSRDGEFWFENQEGEFLCADDILAEYQDWTDTSEWPTSESETAAIKTGIKRQEDPTEKGGVIGAFCRIYGIEEAIEKFLSDVYEPCDVDNRYTFKGGSTSGGLILYENKWAYSHHGTDPTSGKLCNAFDLVRVHLRGHLDEDKEDHTPPNKLPSYLDMMEFASKDEAVKKLMVSERLSAAQEEFGVYQDEEIDYLEEIKNIDIDKKGNPLSTVNTYLIILNYDPKLKRSFVYNEFTGQTNVIKPLPWSNKINRVWEDSDDSCLRNYLGKAPYSLKRSPIIQDVFDEVVKQNTVHPVREYLEKRKWDGVERIETLFIDYLGAEDSAYNRAVTRKSLIAAVTRIFQPGTKFDQVLTLVGPQGKGKTTILEKLGKQWFSNSFNFSMLKGSNGKQAEEQIRGYWLIEIGEMAGLKKAEAEAAKSFLSRTIDVYRPSHGKHTIPFARQCIFFGSTNDEEFLKNTNNGNRRFWPVTIAAGEPTKNVWKDLTESEIDQIWAEAVYYFYEKESLVLSRELEDEALSIQSKHEESDEREGMIMEYLYTPLPENWDSMSLPERRAFIQYGAGEFENRGTISRTKVCAAEIWCELFGKPQGDMNAHNTRFIKNFMRSKAKGWEQYSSTTNFGFYGRQRGYFLLHTKPITQNTTLITHSTQNHHTYN